jgi:hypothetical protein
LLELLTYRSRSTTRLAVVTRVPAMMVSAARRVVHSHAGEGGYEDGEEGTRTVLATVPVM